MPEYISREAAISKLRKRQSDYKGRAMSSAFQDAILIIDDLPSADVAPVVHASWIKNIDDYENTCECSECSYTPYGPLDMTNYCPHCGARMDAKEDTADG